MKRFVLVLLLFIAHTAAAQNKADKDRADKAFAEKDYVTAAYYYDKSLDNETNTKQGTVPYFSTRKKKDLDTVQAAYITYRLAESYRLYQNLMQAEHWYKLVIDNYEASNPLARYWYAVCLRSNKRIDEAIKNLQIFIKGNKTNKQYNELANKELTNCLFAQEQMKHPGLSKVTKMAALNGDAGDFGLTVNNGKYWFTSSRSIGTSGKRINQVYASDKDSLAKKIRVDLGWDHKKEIHYGPASLTTSGTTIYFTIWYKDVDKTVSDIYISHNLSGKWSAAKKLEHVNVAGFNAMQPSVTADSKRLFFASNQPGGQGGTDIWASDLDVNGLPTNAMNLGSKINTADDEQAPYYSEREHKLVYSSKGFIGMGGYDFFESTDSIANAWTKPQNMGYPFNSTKDDLYYSTDDKDTSLVYISSDRESECCLNLFKVKVIKPKPVPPPMFTAILTGQVINCATNKPLVGVSINLTDSTTKQVVNYVSDKNGKYKFKLTYKHVYGLRLEKQDYFAKNIPVPAMSATKVDTLFSPTICQQEYHINKPIVINNILYDFNSYDLKPESKQVLDGLITILNDNPRIHVELGSHTDGLGTDRANNELSQDRAQECVNYIILKGIAPERIIAKGYGKQVPIAPNTTPDGKDNPAGRQLNRRTELTVLSN